jgi:predicted branched-subunit amino acid permease
LLGSGLALFIAWLGATASGYVMGTLVQDPARWGLDFAFPAVIVALLVGMWRGKSDLWPWAVAAGVAVLAARWLPGKWYILLGGLAGSMAGAIRHAD